MGDYASNSDVTITIPARNLGASTKPTTTNIDTWISDIENGWNLKLKTGGYTVPITGTLSERELKRLVVEFVAALVEQSIAKGNNEAVALHQVIKDDATAELDTIVQLGKEGVQFLSDATWSAPTGTDSFHSLEVDEPNSDFVRNPFVSSNDNDGSIPGPNDF